MKFVKIIIWTLLSIALTIGIVLFDNYNCSSGSNISGIALGIVLPILWRSIQDLLDTTDWKSSQTKLKRGGFINNETIVRISFAYLYRIKIGDKYMLVPNKRGTGKYQPVGGVYKFNASEKLELKNRFHVMDDNKISIDESSRNDYRLRLKSKYLRRFVNRFNTEAHRESIRNLGREFKEELVDSEIVNWQEISYRFCGRHMTELKYGVHFQIYELLLADIVELLPTHQQEKDLLRLLTTPSDKYTFVSAKEITTLGIDTERSKLQETIGDHTRNILEENEDHLQKIPHTGDVFHVHL